MGVHVGMLVLTKNVAAMGAINNSIHFPTAYNNECGKLLATIETRSLTSIRAPSFGPACMDYNI